MLYKILIVLATLIWGSSFVVVKDTTDVVSPAWILVVRFALAAFILALVYVRKRELYFRKDYIAFGALFGFLLFMGYYLQTIGITDTTPGKNAFLTAPIASWSPFSHGRFPGEGPMYSISSLRSCALAASVW